MDDGDLPYESGGGDAPSPAEFKTLRSRLREQQSLYEALVAQFDIVCRFLPDTTITFANDAYCRHHGCARDQVIGKRFLHRVPVDLHGHLAALTQGAAAGRMQIYERRYDLPEGGVHWLRWHWVPILGDDGAVAEIQAVGSDITTLKQAQEAAAREHALFRSIVDDQSDPILRYTPDGVRTFVNPAYCRLRGKSAEELLGRSFYDWHSPEFCAFLRGKLDGMRAGAIETFDVEDKSVRGGARWMQWSTRVYGDATGTVVEYQSVGRDITQGRRYRMALERLNRIAAEPGKSAADRVRSLMAFGSNHFELEVGILSRTENGAQVVELCVPPDGGPSPGQRFNWPEGDGEGPTGPFGMEHAGAWPEGLRPAIGDFAPEACFGARFRVDGAVYGGICFCSREPARHDFDAMERNLLELLASWIGHHMDSDLRRLDLEREIELRMRAERLLEQRVGWLERSNAELDQFAYIASHGLQEPLRQIESACAFLRDDYADRFDDDGRTLLSIVGTNSTRMRELVSDLRSYSQIGTAVLDNRPTPLAGVLDEVVKTLRGQIDEAGAWVTYDALPVVDCDETLMRMLFANLISNSLKYRTARTPHIVIEASESDDCWTFSVTDNGIGIDNDRAELVFEIFRRLHGRTEYSGTGMGLAICRRVVERHDGQIWLDTDYGDGARFRFLLPRG